MIGYSDATVTALNHPLIMRSKTSLARATATVHSCGGNFVIRLYLIPLISSQSIVSLSSKFFHPPTKHGLWLVLRCLWPLGATKDTRDSLAPVMLDAAAIREWLAALL